MLTGDTHADLFRFSALGGTNQRDKIGKGDFLCVLGDFGFIWDSSAMLGRSLKIMDSLPYKVLFVDGNHENFDLLEQFPTQEWCGGEIGVISENVYHLKRGHVFTLPTFEGDKKVFVFGGGLSIDREMRLPGRSWWPQEIPTREEVDLGLKNLAEHDFKVDYVLSHTLPTSAVALLEACEYIIPDTTSDMLQEFLDAGMTFETWYSGHFHVNECHRHESGGTIISMYEAFTLLGMPCIEAEVRRF